eukprot:Gregarina_sp_Pseudo_9__4649@NODE_483_length_2733_cov_157_210468_g455_i0_p1_GENE_NODE_483_length_2733_cov_157_210468_g455_i0NODE_483_length_2733_cov_157_210468_g455_i0_p1_ORF_typecomplete_len598_score67_73UDPGP/PF01704_18/8_1e69_NODE_483_length_2733_cov_157_210468_g455_i0541796
MTDYAAWKEKLLSSEYNQAHLFENITDTNVEHSIIDQLVSSDRNYPGGLINYLQRARKLLADSKAGANPFEGYTPETPSVLQPIIGSEEFYELEKTGLEEVQKCAFVLVAGGLGERLGYPNIKISLLTNSLNGVTYCEWYFRCIHHFQVLSKECSGKDVVLPVAIMTSGDTHERTVKLLQDNDYFCLTKDQITIMMQEKVPALIDADGRISIKDGRIETKPHGHGDVHTLLHQNNLPSQWLKQGLEWVFFFHDTNALSMRSLPVCLGISKKKNYSMNSLCIPRTPGDSVGGICRLVKEGSKTVTVNVEYNQLDGLLKSAGLSGDVAAPNSEYSAFPGNCNILVFKLGDYDAILQETGGAVPEFVNPKYADATKTKFKSATRVECMMQEFARLWKPGQEVGATVLDRWFCFSTVKNNIKDAATKLKSKLPGESAFTADAEFYQAACKCLEYAMKKSGSHKKCSIEAAETVSFHEMAHAMGSKVYLDPSWGLTITEMSKALEACSSISLTRKSALSLTGRIAFRSLNLDGYAALANPCRGGVFDLGDIKVENRGVVLKEIDLEDEANGLEHRVRGYRLKIDV